MKVFGSFNNVSEEIKKRVPKLKKGQVVEYQLLKGFPDPIRPGQLIHPFAKRLKTMFRIWDPGANKGQGEFVDVGLIRGKDKEGNVIPAPGTFIRGGKMGLEGGIVANEELYEILELSDENESNPYRDKSVEPKFKRVDEVRDAEVRTRRRNDKLEALTYISSLNPEEARELAASLGWNEQDELTVINDKLGEFAEKEPKKLLDFLNDPMLKNRALIKIAETKGIIKFDRSTNRAVWGATDAPIASLDRADGKTEYDAMADWIAMHKDGNKTMENIRNQINAEIKKANVKPDPSKPAPNKEG